MAATFTWKISQLERLCETGEIQTVHYVVDARTEDLAYSAGAYGSLGLDPADPGSMIPFASVTEDEVLTWVKHKLTGEKVAEVEAALQKQLDEQRTPTVAQGLPWAVAA
jgi:hypothetical protein